LKDRENDQQVDGNDSTTEKEGKRGGPLDGGERVASHGPDYRMDCNLCHQKAVFSEVEKERNVRVEKFDEETGRQGHFLMAA